MAGLAYIPCKFHLLDATATRELTSRTVCIGVVLSLGVFAIYTRYHDKKTAAGAEWTKNHIYRRLPLACIASPWYAILLYILTNRQHANNSLQHGHLPLLARLDRLALTVSHHSFSWRHLLRSRLPASLHGNDKLSYRRLPKPLRLCSWRICHASFYRCYHPAPCCR